MRKTWKVRVQKYVDGKLDATIDTFVKNRRRANEILIDEYLEYSKLIEDEFNLDESDDFNLFVDVEFDDNMESFKMKTREGLFYKDVMYEGLIVKD